jgi:tetratricopeptide (TPR) repeat protein
MDTHNASIYEAEPQVKNKLESISYIILLITLFLSPLLFISTGYFPLESVKAEVIIFGTLISLILYVLSLLRKRSISCSRNLLSVTSVLIVVSTVISALLSSNIQKSLIGQGFEIGTASFLILMFVSMFFVSKLVTKNKDRLLTIYGTFMLSFLLTALFHVLRLIISPSFLSFGSLNSITSTLIGKWSDLGVFAGAMFLLAFFALTLFTVRKSVKFLIGVLFVLSAFIVFLVNSPVIWSVLALVFLSYGIYQYVQSPAGGSGLKKIVSRISFLTLILVIVSVGFVWKSVDLRDSVLKPLYQEQNEIVLPWQLTLDVTADTIKERPLFGAGPNRFGTEFLLHKPAVLNPSIFWGVEFGTGFGFLPSMMVTHGIVGTILWVLFLVFFFILGIRGLKGAKETFSKFSIVSSFLVSAFLWVMFILYSPSHALLFFAFVMTGLFLGVLASEGMLPTKEYQISGASNSNKIVTPVIVIVLILVIVWTLIYVKKIVALAYFQGGVSALSVSSNQDIDGADKYFKSALSWDNSDIYHQVISGIKVMKTTPIIQVLQEQSKKDPKSIDQGLVQQLTVLISEAASSSASAIKADPTNYYNYVAEAKVFELASSLQMDGAYERARESYANALKYNPLNPSIYLSLAQLEVSKNKMDEAQQFIGNALQLKQNYTEAIFLLSQIQVSQNRIKDAIISAQVLTQINPQNPLLFFQLGFLYYNDKNYEGATQSLGKAVELNSQYANARYFLGLSLARLGKNKEAIAEFEEIAKTNNDNEEVVSILANLKAGKSPFTDAKDPTSTTPEKRSTLPVKEKTANPPATSKIKNTN